jgi:hypothetical protein
MQWRFFSRFKFDFSKQGCVSFRSKVALKIQRYFLTEPGSENICERKFKKAS